MLPIFEKLGIKAHIFVPTKFISDGIKSSSYMNAGQIKEFSDLGHIVGSHSHSHPRNISLLGKEQIENEWLLSKDILENITGKRVVSCAIPGGFYSKVQLGILKNLGYNLIFNSVPTFNKFEFNQIALNGRFSIEKNTTNQQMNLILDMNFFNQQKLKIRQCLSQKIHTLKHKIILNEK
jgi:peptidoglycan/xylan/chitin deacetylase (PgdA/CDA1 family)